jgi:transmembrane sensor
MSAEDNLQGLILKKLNGTISEAEAAMLRELLVDPENGNMFQETERIWIESQKIEKPRQFDPSERWNRLQAAVEDEAPVKAPTRSWMRYAAALSALALLAAVYFYSQYNSTVTYTASGETKNVRLPDGSMVTLNAGAEISYNEDAFANERNVKMSGEAFFEVQKNGSRFSVSTSNGSVTVLGTSFIVKASSSETKVSCFTGKVNVSNNHDNSVLLTAGLGATVHENVLSEAYQVNQELLSWMQGEFNFRNTLLKAVFEKIGHRFDKTIISNPRADTLRFTGDLEATSLENTLEGICLSAGLKFQVAGDSVIIR